MIHRFLYQIEINCPFSETNPKAYTSSRMVHLSYVLLLTLASFAACQEMSSGKCKDGNIRSGDEYQMTCCSGEWHVVARSPNWYRSCDVEPSDPNLSYEDSSWLAYDCLVRKSLRPKELSLKSYATFVAGKSESRLIDLFDDEPFRNATNDESEGGGGVQTTKLYFFEYFQAIQEVCKYGYNQTDSSIGNNMTAKPALESALKYLHPGVLCSNGVIPLLRKPSKPSLPDYSVFKECEMKLKAFVGNVTSKEIYRNASDYCWSAVNENLVLEDIPGTLVEFEKFLALLWPRFWSKVVKQNSTRDLVRLLKLSNDITIDSDAPEVVLPAVLATIRKNLRSALEDGERINIEDIVVNGILADNILRESEYIRDYAACSGPQPSDLGIGLDDLI